MASTIQSTDLTRVRLRDCFLATFSPPHESSFSVRVRKKPSAANRTHKQASTVSIMGGVDREPPGLGPGHEVHSPPDKAIRPLSSAPASSLRGPQ